VEGGHYNFRVNQRPAAVVRGLGRAFFQYGHHPRELAELRLVVRVADYPETDATRIPMAAVRAGILHRQFRNLGLVLHAHATFLHIVGTHAQEPTDNRAH